jgi:hypothetical protein
MHVTSDLQLAKKQVVSILNICCINFFYFLGLVCCILCKVGF